MKKLLAILLALACVFSFAACASKKTDDSVSGTPSTSEQQPTEKPEAPAEKPEAPAEEPSDDENATMSDDGMLDDAFGAETPSDETAPAAEGGVQNDESAKAALDLLNGIWATYTENEKFPAAGGDYDANVDDAAGNVNIANADTVSYLLTFPAADVVKLDGAASIMHMMNGNTFTCGAFHAANADDVASIVEDIHSAISGKHWMCGFPDKMLIASSGNMIVSVYGNEDLVNTFRDKLFAQDASFTAVYDEAISA